MRTALVAVALLVSASVAVALAAQLPPFAAERWHAAQRVNGPASDAMIAAINGDATSTWRAGHNARFAGETTYGDVRHMLGVHKRAQRVPSAADAGVALDTSALPASFDSRTAWSDCTFGIADQGQCGSSPVFGEAEAFQQRMCVATKGAVHAEMSVEYMLACDTNDYGCNGGYLTTGWQFLEQHGTVTNSCVPYSSGSGNVDKCPTDDKCADGSKWQLYYAKAGSTHSFKSEEEIQASLMQYGVVTTAIDVYSDFFTYKSGVYSHKSGSLEGGHGVAIIGWGVDAGTPYWLVQNSWGTAWGMDGLFKILRGQDECKIMTYAAVGLADPTRH